MKYLMNGGLQLTENICNGSADKIQFSVKSGKIFYAISILFYFK